MISRANVELRACHGLLIVAAIACACATALAQNNNSQGEGEGSSRQIVLDRFNKARPSEGTTTPSVRTRTRASLKAAIYRRTGPLRPRVSTRIQFEEVGVTVWRLRPTRSS